MKFLGNIQYYIKSKHNKDLPNKLKDLFDCNTAYYSFWNIVRYSKELSLDKTQLNMLDMGAGSRKFKSNKRTVSDIYRSSASSLEYCLFYQKLINLFNFKNILELGTSLGVGTLSFATASKDVKVTSIDACPNTSKYTQRKFQNKNIHNVRFIVNTFDEVFAKDLLKNECFDLVFIDGNHLSESTLFYYKYILENLSCDKTCFLIDDINWSKDMYSAWHKISSTTQNNLRLNTGRMGILFHNFFDNYKNELRIKFINKEKLMI